MRNLELITYVLRGLAIVGFLVFAIKGAYHIVKGWLVKEEKWRQIYKSVDSFVLGISFWAINLFVYDFQNIIRIIALGMWVFIMTTVLLFRYFGIPFMEKHFNKNKSV